MRSHLTIAAQTRSILIRERNGDLRTANPDERDSINFKYFPQPDKSPRPVAAFEDKPLKVDLHIC